MTIKDVKRLNNEAGYKFFARDTMRFFASRIESGLYANGTFITSEKASFRDATRRYTVRRVRPDYSIATIGDFCGHATLTSARNAAKLA